MRYPPAARRWIIQFLSPAGERARSRRQLPRRRRDGQPGLVRPVEQPGVGGQDPLVQLAELDAGLGTQLPDQGLPGMTVGSQRLALAAAPVQRQHELGVEPFPQRKLDRQRLEFRQQLAIPAEVQPGLDPPFGGLQAQLLQPGGLISLQGR
jgi:hypothetical protein